MVSTLSTTKGGGNLRRCGTARGKREPSERVQRQSREEKQERTDMESVHSRDVSDKPDERPLAGWNTQRVSPVHARRRQ
jgi:hypothetical protein